MKEWSQEKTTIKTVEEKKSHSWSKPEAEKPKALIALKGLKYSTPKGSWSVNAGDDCSGMSEDKLAILRSNGAI